MVIGIVHNANIYGGIENQIVSLIDSISPSCTVYFFTRFPESLLAERLHNYVRLIPLHGNIVQEYRDIKKYILKEKIDIIQFHTFDVGLKYRLIKLLVRDKVKIVVRVHTYIACSWIPKWKKRLYYFMDALSSWCVDKYILNGKYLMVEMQSNTWIDKKKMIDVLDGTKTFDMNPIIKLEQCNIDSPRLLMIANVLPHKGHNVLIDALKLLKDRNKNVSCDIVGAIDRDQVYMDYLKKMISDLKIEQQVRFLGFDSDVKKHLLTHKIVILPSDSEGTPNCIMEAMSMKRLVVVTDTGGVSEFVEDGVTGFLHAPKSAEALAETIIRVMNYSVDELEQICENGYRFWKENLSIKAMSEKFLNTYSTL